MNELNQPVTSQNFVNKIWEKVIPRINAGFLILYLLFVFGVDVFVLLSASTHERGQYMSFWYIMLAVLAVYFLFFCLENFIFKKRFRSTTSRLDSWIVFFIVVRNIVFLLNFIPFIQLLGLFIDFFAGWAIVIIYAIFMFLNEKYRHSSSAPQTLS